MYISQDPNDLSEWGDLTPSVEADPVLGAALQQEIEPSSSWIEYVPGKPEGCRVKRWERKRGQVLGRGGDVGRW